jgi:hypothetical protein
MNKVVTPIFLKASEMSRDNFWKRFYQDLSFGIYPTGLFLSDSNTLSCRMKGCEFDYPIPRNVKSIHRDLKNILEEKLNIRSTVILREIDTQQTWSDIKKKSLKERLLEQYAVRLMKKHNFTIHQTRVMQSFLMLGFQLNVLNNDDVTFDNENYQIVSINGVNVVNDQVIFTNPVKVDPIKPIKSTSSMGMNELWDKFLKTM